MVNKGSSIVFKPIWYILNLVTLFENFSKNLFLCKLSEFVEFKKYFTIEKKKKEEAVKSLRYFIDSFYITIEGYLYKYDPSKYGYKSGFETIFWKDFEKELIGEKEEKSKKKSNNHLIKDFCGRIKTSVGSKKIKIEERSTSPINKKTIDPYKTIIKGYETLISLIEDFPKDISKEDKCFNYFEELRKIKKEIGDEISIPEGTISYDEGKNNLINFMTKVYTIFVSMKKIVNHESLGKNIEKSIKIIGDFIRKTRIVNQMDFLKMTEKESKELKEEYEEPSQNPSELSQNSSESFEVIEIEEWEEEEIEIEPLLEEKV